MKKYSKKIALILVLALTIALAVPALAYQTSISGSYTDDDILEINVVVAGGSNVNAFLNPGGMKANVYGCGKDTQAHKHDANCPVKYTLNPSGDITTMPIMGVNNGGNTVKVKATVTSVVNGKFKFASSAPKEDAKTTTGLVYLRAQPVEGKLGFNVNDEGKISFDEGQAATALNAWKDSLDAYATGRDTDNKTAFKNEFNKLKNSEIVILKKGTATSKTELCQVEAGNSFVARLTGWIGLGDDSKDAKKWSSNDGFGASVIWSFEAVKAKPE